MEEFPYVSSTLLCIPWVAGVGGGEGPPVGAGLGQSVRKMSGMHVYLQGLAEVVEATLLA